MNDLRWRGWWFKIKESTFWSFLDRMDDVEVSSQKGQGEEYWVGWGRCEMAPHFLS